MLHRPHRFRAGEPGPDDLLDGDPADNVGDLRCKEQGGFSLHKTVARLRPAFKPHAAKADGDSGRAPRRRAARSCPCRARSRAACTRARSVAQVRKSSCSGRAREKGSRSVRRGGPLRMSDRPRSVQVEHGG